MKNKASVFILTLLVIGIIVFAFILNNKNDTGISENTNGTDETVIRNDDVRISYTFDPTQTLIVKTDSQDLTLPFEGDVGVDVGFVNDSYIAVNFMSSAGQAHFTGGYIVDRASRNATFIESKAGETFLGFAQGGTSYLSYDSTANTISLRKLNGDEIENYGTIEVAQSPYLPDFIPLRANFSPTDETVIIGGTGYYGDRDRGNEHHLLYALTIASGDIVPVQIAENSARSIEWLSNDEFELTEMEEGKDRAVTAFVRKNGEWQGK